MQTQVVCGSSPVARHEEQPESHEPRLSIPMYWIKDQRMKGSCTWGVGS